MSQYGSQEKIWVVKSSGQILGPYSTDEMKFLLERRKISIIDEAREPKARWGFIRENPLFASIVETLRDEEANFLDNETEAGQRTRTITATDELTPTPRVQSYKSTAPSGTPLVPIREQDYLIDPRRTPGMPLPSKRKKEGLNLPTIFTVAAVLFLISAGYFYFGRTAGPKAYSNEDLIRLARVHRNLGLYEKSLGFYKKAAANGGLDLASNVQMATLLLEGTPQTTESRRLLESALGKLNTTDVLRGDAQLALGLSYLKEGNYNRADEIYQSILFADGNQKEARLNLGLSKMLRSDFHGALKEFNNFTKSGRLEGIAVLGRAISNLGINEGAADASGLKASIEELSRYMATSYEYRIEALLLKSVIHQKLGNMSESQKVAAVLLEEDPFLTQDHIHNILIDRQILRWDRLSMYCDFLNLKWGEIALSKSLSAYCSSQRQDLISALNKLEDSRKQFPKSNALMAQHAMLLYRLKRIPESQQLAQQSESESLLSQRVAALDCEEVQNWECADSKWRKLLATYPNDLGALRGASEYQWMKNHNSQALDYVKTGLAVSESYRPLLELKEKIDAP